MNDFNVPAPNIASLPATDVKITVNPSGIVQTESYPIKPVNNTGDYLIPVKKSVVIKIYDNLTELKKIGFQWDELFLIIFSLTSSASITAVLSNAEYSHLVSVILFTVFPAISVGALVFAIMLKWHRQVSPKNSIDGILSEIKPIIEYVKKEEKNESK